MKIPKFGQPQNPDPYTIPQPGSENKKRSLLMFGGLAVVLIMLGMLLFGGGAPAGREDSLSAIDATAEALGAIDEYDKELKRTPVKNEIAIVKTILRGNYQSLGTLYKNTYDKKKSFPSNPKLDARSTEILDTAVKNNTIDAALVEVLRPKITAVQRSLIAMKPNFNEPESLKTLSTAQADYQAVSDILEKQ